MSRGELMIKLGYDEIIERIVEKSDLDKAEIEAKITKKLKQLEGLISKEGAAHIVANQLGIKLIEKISGRLQIKNILSGMRDVETVGKIIRIYPARRFSVDGREGQVANMVIGDETSSIKLVLWGDHADQAKNAKQGMVVKVIGGYVKERDNTKELHLGTRGSLALNPRGETVAEVAIPVAQRKRINELKEGMNDVEVYGTVIQMFEPRFYEICPSCGKRMNQREDKFACETHGEQQPKLGYVLNLFLDDGLDTIRAVFFRQTALNLLNISDEQMCEFKETPDSFEATKQEMLGQVIKVGGRVVQNKMFERLEIMSSFVDPKPDPDDVLKILNKELENSEQEETKIVKASSVSEESLLD